MEGIDVGQGTSPVRFAVAYVALGIAAVAALVSAVAIASMPKHVATHKDVAAAVGDQNLGKMCEAATIQQVDASGGVVQKVHALHVTHHGANDATVMVRLSSNLYVGNIACDYHKSTWQQTNIRVAR